jgi:expansin
MFCVVAVAVAVGLTQATGSACAAAGLAADGTVPAEALSTTSGEATHYVLQSGGGNCSYRAPPADQLYVALPPSQYGAASACGSYLDVTGPDGSVQVEVVDRCPECQTGHIDLSDQAFARIAPLAAGLVQVSYHTIVNPHLSAPLSFLVKEGSSAYWLALLPIGTGDPVASLQVRTSTGGWRDLAHASYNYWLAASGMGPGPFTVRLTDTAGHQVTVGGITLSPGIVQSTSVWMYGAGTPAPHATPLNAPPSRRRSAPTAQRALAAGVLAAAGAHSWKELLPVTRSGPESAPAPSC